jgi:hypothetical protein
MDDVAKGLHSHQMVHFNRVRLANTVDIIACEIHQHEMLGSIFLRVQQLLTQLLVL